MNWFRLKRRAVRHHVPLLVLTILIVTVIGLVLPHPEQRLLASMGTGYASLILIGVTLVLGPLRALRGRNAPITYDLRRDTGIWAGGLALLHVALGLQIHMRGQMWLYFLPPSFPTPMVRADLFGAANYLGLIAALLVAVLLSISNDLSLQWLGPHWKPIQRWNSVIFATTLAHVLAYQIMEHRTNLWFALDGLVALSVLILRSRPRLKRRL